MKRLIAIGDVHGCLSELRQLVDQLAPQPGDHIVFLGDYVDRGPDSAGVLRFLLAFAEGSYEHDVDVTFLRGNHEQMMLDARAGGRASPSMHLWLRNGGGKTIESYQTGPPTLPVPGWLALVPEAHWRFIEQTTMYLEVGRYLFVHAGVDPTLSVEQNLLKPYHGSFLWERRHQGLDTDLSMWGRRVVVCGHTITPHPVLRPQLVSIDTGAFLPYLTARMGMGRRPGQLTAAVLDRDSVMGTEFISVSAGGQDIHQADAEGADV